jgi:hypothetical protein
MGHTTWCAHNGIKESNTQEVNMKIQMGFTLSLLTVLAFATLAQGETAPMSTPLAGAPQVAGVTNCAGMEDCRRQCQEVKDKCDKAITANAERLKMACPDSVVPSAIVGKAIPSCSRFFDDCLLRCVGGFYGY